MSNYTIRNQNEHRYFTMMLNMAEDDLGPFEYRLLAHFVRWAGQGGSETKSVRQMAEKTRMSVARVRKALQSLEMAGYIIVKTPTESERRAHQPTTIIVVDRWSENIARYIKETTVSNMTQNCVKYDTVTPETVSNMTQSPPETVSNMTQLEELDIEEQSLEEQETQSCALAPEKPSQDDANAPDDAREPDPLEQPSQASAPAQIPELSAPGAADDAAREVVERYQARGLTVPLSWWTSIQCAVEDDGLPAVLDAVDIAFTAGKTSWRYVEGILRNKRNERALAAQRAAAERDAKALLEQRIEQEMKTKLAILGVTDEAA